MPLICPIPLDETFDLPEGRYRARLASVRPQTRQSHRGTEPMIRLLFEVQIPSLQNKTPMAGRTFPFDLRRQSELRGVLEAWRGAQLFASAAAKYDFEQLVGRDADLVLVHIHHDDHPRPYVLIESIHPPGTLKLTEKATANVVPVTREIAMPENFSEAA